MTDSVVNNDTKESKSEDMFIPCINNIGNDDNHDNEKNHDFNNEINEIKKIIEKMRCDYVKELDEIKKSNEKLLSIIAMNNVILQPLEEMAAPDIEC